VKKTWVADLEETGTPWDEAGIGVLENDEVKGKGSYWIPHTGTIVNEGHRHYGTLLDCMIPLHLLSVLNAG